MWVKSRNQLRFIAPPCRLFYYNGSTRQCFILFSLLFIARSSLVVRLVSVRLLCRLWSVSIPVLGVLIVLQTSLLSPSFHTHTHTLSPRVRFGASESHVNAHDLHTLLTGTFSPLRHFTSSHFRFRKRITVIWLFILARRLIDSALSLMKGRNEFIQSECFFFFFSSLKKKRGENRNAMQVLSWHESVTVATVPALVGGCCSAPEFQLFSRFLYLYRLFLLCRFFQGLELLSV